MKFIRQVEAGIFPTAKRPTMMTKELPQRSRKKKLKNDSTVDRPTRRANGNKTGEERNPDY